MPAAGQNSAVSNPNLALRSSNAACPAGGTEPDCRFCPALGNVVPQDAVDAEQNARDRWPGGDLRHRRVAVPDQPQDISDLAFEPITTQPIREQAAVLELEDAQGECALHPARSASSTSGWADSADPAGPGALQDQHRPSAQQAAMGNSPKSAQRPPVSHCPPFMKRFPGFPDFRSRGVSSLVIAGPVPAGRAKRQVVAPADSSLRSAARLQGGKRCAVPAHSPRQYTLAAFPPRNSSLVSG